MIFHKGDIVVCHIPAEGPQGICHDSANGGGVGIVTLYETPNSVFLTWLHHGPRHYNHKEGDIVVPAAWLQKIGAIPCSKKEI